MNRFKNILIAVLVIVLSLLFFRQCNNASYYKNIVNQSKDSLKISRDENGLLIAEIGIVELSKKDLKKELDSVKINRNTRMVTIIKSGASIVSVSIPTIIHDTILQQNRR